MNVAVVVPYRPDSGHRDAAWARIRSHYATSHPDWPVLVGDAPGDWVKALAVADALTRTDADVLVIADADSYVPPAALRAAVDSLGAWAMPHRLVKRLTAAEDGLDREPYKGVIGGGITVIRRDVYADCPLDPRFRGWGGEDVSWGCALWTLHGLPWRGLDDLTHLWHPSARVGQVGPPASEVLTTAYSKAFHKPDLMRPLVEEAKRCFLPGFSRTR